MNHFNEAKQCTVLAIYNFFFKITVLYMYLCTYLYLFIIFGAWQACFVNYISDF